MTSGTDATEISTEFDYKCGFAFDAET